MSTESTPQTDTLFGGRKVTVQYDNGESEEITVRQLKLKDYETAFKQADDELALVAFICGKAKHWLTNESKAVSPASYEGLYAVAQEVNAQGFFAWSLRRVAAAKAQINGMDPRLLQLAMEAGRSTSPPSWPGSPPRPA